MKAIILSGFLFIYSGLILCQEIASEGQLRNEAETYFLNRQYPEARSLYSRLLSVYPKDPVFNFRYGVSLFFADRSDVSKPLQYLQQASSSLKDEPELDLYLGLVLHMNMRFEEALPHYRKFLDHNADQAYDRFNIPRRIEECTHGSGLLRRNIVEETLHREDLKYDQLHKGYPSKDIAGKLLIKPDYFQTAIDAAREETSFVFMPEDRKFIMFGSYGDEQGASKDIFMRSMMADGEWGSPVRLGPEINTSYDEDYPVLAHQGKVLYFASRGHNTMGGYDVFRSVLDTTSGRWSTPVNMDHGVNSPFDDFIFIPDVINERAYIATDRFTTGEERSVLTFRMQSTWTSDISIILAFGASSPPGQTTVQIPEKKILQEQVVPAGETGQESTVREEHGQQLVREREQASGLADSAFLLASLTRESIHELQNVRSRASDLSDRKKAAALNLMIRRDSLLEAARTETDETIREVMLDEADQMNQLQAQHIERSAHALRIGKDIHRQINTRTLESERWSQQAAGVQLASATGTLEETRQLFNSLRDQWFWADTLKDYYPVLDEITHDRISYAINVPPLAVADYSSKEIAVTPVIPHPQESMADSSTTAPGTADPFAKEVHRLAQPVLESLAEERQIMNRSAVTITSSLDSFHQVLHSYLKSGITHEDTLLPDTLRDTLLFHAREAVAADGIYQALSWHLDEKSGDERLAAHLTELADAGKSKEATDLLPSLRTVTGYYSPPPDIRKLVLQALPAPNELKKQQASGYFKTAETYKADYDQLMQEAAGWRYRADQKKSEKKRREYNLEAEKIERRAAVKLNNYEKNLERGNELLDTYNEALTARDVTNRILDRITPPVEAVFPSEVPIVPDEIVKEKTAVLSDGRIFSDNTGIVDVLFREALAELGTVSPVSLYVLGPNGLKTEGNFIKGSREWLSACSELLELYMQQMTGGGLYRHHLEDMHSIGLKLDTLEKDITAEMRAAGIEEESLVPFSTAPSDPLQLASAIQDKVTTETRENERKMLLLEWNRALRLSGLQRYLKAYLGTVSLDIPGHQDNQMILARSYVEEAGFLFMKAWEQRSRISEKPGDDLTGYWLEDARVFEEAAIEQLDLARAVFREENPMAPRIISSLEKDPFSSLDVISGLLKEVDGTGHEESVVLPVEPKVPPDAILFRVQLMATGTEPAPEVFEGVGTVTREPVMNSRVTRYLAGNFSSHLQAEEACRTFREKGFRDAFAVGYRNGERIPREEWETPVQQHITITEEPEAPPFEEQQPEKTRKPTIPAGTVYYVQLGTFSREKPDSDFPGLGPILREKTEKGLFRHLAGSYPNTTEAKTALSKARTTGFPDAYLVTYQAGQRTHSIQAQTAELPPSRPAPEDDRPQTGKVTFSVQLGVFNQIRDPQWIRGMEQLSGITVTSYNTPSGAYGYIAGSYPSVTEAETLKKSLSEKGLNEVFVVAFRDGKRISVEEAVSLSGQNP
ncbi:MAG: tetratricopeptide repeat protein [Bacteroidales bacterium]|nr:tetratricopeptide repeat protein [Bacteroidales bacterium]